MGWSGGSGMFWDIAKVIKNEVKDDKVKYKIYDAMIKAFEDQDCDTLDECEGIDDILDQALKDNEHLYDEDEED